MKVTDISVDLETFGKGDSAVLASIGLTSFNRNTGQIIETIELCPRMQDQVDAGAEMDVSTVLWWVGQSDEARKKIVEGGGINPRSAAETIVEFISRNQARDFGIWGNGATFDLTKLKNFISRAGIKAEPWAFWCERDMRTIVDIGWTLGLNHKKTIEFDGVPHSAGDDSKHQAKVIAAYLQDIQAIGSKKSTRPKSQYELDA